MCKLSQICKQSCNKVVVTTIYQDVLVPSCCDKSATSYYYLVTSLVTMIDLLQVVPTRLIQAVRKKLLRACCHQLVTCRRYQTCWNNLLRVCWPHQLCNKMITISTITALSMYSRDVAWLGSCDDGCLALAELLGWKVRNGLSEGQLCPSHPVRRFIPCHVGSEARSEPANRLRGRLWSLVQ